MVQLTNVDVWQHFGYSRLKKMKRRKKKKKKEKKKRKKVSISWNEL